ncbi:hypothetical protein N7471_013658 [Penicillium samsonianum]|uniref:uncharacterized protein n=1 Tax=Penicillium samsonianum TaxID=1882272 RepID=UPI002548AFF8|nr:uncharacterized protein N7471_013658 [Penicillium samsonianum]KAJ6118191.1 hypothetical protein N7471_013658 [Penicillium samsonianum]
MPQALVPSSAAAFAPRTPPSVVRDANVPQWLKVTLKRRATWTLCWVMLEGLLGMIHLEAYVVHVDMVSREEVGFKLTKEPISTLEGCFDILQHRNLYAH